MSPLELLAVLGAGLGAGVLTSTVGVASLLSFPTLVAVGLPPVVANASNTIGLTPGGLSGTLGYRREIAEAPGVAKVVFATSALGAVAGAFLLLALPSVVFERLVPWLILFTCLLVGAQPPLRSWLKNRSQSTDAQLRLRPLATFFALVTGVYGGYFGAGSGVMMMAVLGLSVDLEVRVINALKTASVMASNVVATLIFVVIAEVDWLVVAVLASGSIVGGYVGARIGRRLPAPLLRGLVVVVGVIAAILLM